MKSSQVYLGKTRISISLEVPCIDEDIIEDFIKAVKQRKGFKNLSDDVLKQMDEEIYNQRIEEYKEFLNPDKIQIRYNDLERFEYYPGLKDKILQYIHQNAKDVDGFAIVTIELVEPNKA